MANKQMQGKRPPIKKGIIGRLIKMLFKEYKWQMIAVIICIVLVSFASTIASIFMQQFIEYIKDGVAYAKAGLDHKVDEIFGKILTAILIMLAIYAVGWVASFTYTRIMAVVTQSFLGSIRKTTRYFQNVELVACVF